MQLPQNDSSPSPKRLPRRREWPGQEYITRRELHKRLWKVLKSNHDMPFYRCRLQSEYYDGLTVQQIQALPEEILSDKAECDIYANAVTRRVDQYTFNHDRYYDKNPDFICVAPPEHDPK